MGLLSRLRSHENSPKPQTKRGNGHKRGLTSGSSSASEFLATSFSSHSSVDSPKLVENHKDQSTRKPPPAAIELPKRGMDTPLQMHPMPGQYNGANKGPMRRSPNEPEPSSHSQHHPQQQYQQAPQAQHSYQHNGGRPQSSFNLPKTRVNQVYNQDYPSPQMHPPSGLSRGVSDLSLSETDYSSSDINSGTECDDDLEFSAAQNHPYYNQWKQYYQAMALYQALMAQKQGGGNVSARNSMFPGALPSSRIPSALLLHSRSASAANNFDATMNVSDNNLLRNSRKCTMKSNRSASVPLLYQNGTVERSNTRSVSVDVSAPIQTLDDNSPEIIDDKPTQSVLVASPSKRASHNLHEMLSEPRGTRQISDYGAFLQSDDDSRLSSPEPQPRNPEPSKLSTVSLPGSEDDILHDLEVYSLPPESPKKSVGFEPPTIPGDDLNRQNSSASTTSYNSLQSEKNFFVSKTPHRVSTITSQSLARIAKVQNSGPTFVPPMAGPPPPIFTNTPREVPEPMTAYNPGTGTELHRHSMINLNAPPTQMYMQAVPQQHYQSQILPMRPYLMYQPQLQQMMAPQASAPTYSTDPVINQRIEEFIQLRSIIASGNKTLEYRLKWMKMLLIAVNYKLFSYINVRGSAVAPDQVMANKHLFIKSFVTHLQKLLRELDSNKDPRKNKMFAEVCYVQGCLYMNDFIEKYSQDFGFERHDGEAERFFQHCLELDPACFRAYYKLGELYESHETEEKFDMALEHYKESAKMGYNKAIYKVALIFLFVPKVRLIKFYRYLKDLASIDMESTDIQLEGPDREELEEVVGLALFQLGKVHEGIYPGDLTLEDEFVTEATSIAKVDYAKSLSFYNRAAKVHCLEAQVRLGRIYEFGELNRKPNAGKSIQWYIKASTSPLKFKRHPEAMLGVSRWFLKGSDGTSKHIPYPNPETAITWCERACKEFKYPEAYYQMGLLVEGDFVKGDAYEWFAEAAQHGHAEAQARLHT
ncbi:hypothetical protein PUMCH_000442 [Australozyma saopauloensis]|uniref:Activator of C kinase protein 1 n=1 Tax=Australozyma saopauloensis TaxID=291208 RepID=A0AAX4H4S9_9ASCO|nr:hypothetical protein PUMCH_000442 [[Candida] saopauloensis]